MATTVRAIPRVAASSAMVPPSEFPARSTGSSRPSSRIDLSRPSTRFGIVGGVPPGNAGVEPKPAISNAMTRRVDSRYGVTALQAAFDMPIPCRRTSGGPDPVSRKCHKAYPHPVMPGDRPSPRVIAVLLRRRAGRAGRDRRGDAEPSRYANCRFAKRIGSHTPRHASRLRSDHGASRLIAGAFRSSHPP